jgi:hypothetical protein
MCCTSVNKFDRTCLLMTRKIKFVKFSCKNILQILAPLMCFTLTGHSNQHRSLYQLFTIHGLTTCNLDVRGSVHHSIIYRENPARCKSVSKFWHGYVLHQGTASQVRALCKSQMKSRVLRHTAAAMRAHNVLQGTVEELRWTIAAFLVYVLRCCT